MAKCTVCGKDLDKDKALFKKGKFFCNKDCEKKFAKKADKGDKNVCEFC